jgi:hypothetical protein
MDFAAFKE